MNSLRFIKTNHSKNDRRVRSLPVSNDFFCEFYVRLFSLFGNPNAIPEEGFNYNIYDQENDFYFSAALTGFGPGYFAETDGEKVQKILEEFHQILFAKELVLKNCSMTYSHDFGETSFAYKDGSFISTHKEY